MGVDRYDSDGTEHNRWLPSLDHGLLQLHSRQHQAQRQGPQAGGSLLCYQCQVTVYCTLLCYLAQRQGPQAGGSLLDYHGQVTVYCTVYSVHSFVT